MLSVVRQRKIMDIDYCNTQQQRIIDHNVETKEHPQNTLNKKGKPQIKFGNTYIREFERIVGDNPSCSNGPPLSLGWSHFSNKAIPVDEFENTKDSSKKNARKNTNDKGPIRLNDQQRNKILADWGEISYSNVYSLGGKTRRRRKGKNLKKGEKEEAMSQKEVFVQQINKEIQRLPRDLKHAYNKAKTLCPFLLITETDPFRFLLFEKFDIAKAAKRLAMHWKLRLQIFGRERAFRSLYDLSGNGALSKRDVEEFNTGSIELLPCHSNEKLILFANNPQHDSTYTVEEDERTKLGYPRRMRLLFYLLKIASDSGRSLVLLRYHKAVDMETRTLDSRFQQGFTICTSCFTLEIDSVNFLLMDDDAEVISSNNNKNDVKKGGVITELKQQVEKTNDSNINQKHLAISGHSTKILCGVLKEAYGISKSHLPECVGGSWRYDNFAIWCTALRQVQSIWRQRGFADENNAYSLLNKFHLSRWENLHAVTANDVPKKSAPDKTFSDGLPKLLETSDGNEKEDDYECNGHQVLNISNYFVPINNNANKSTTIGDQHSSKNEEGCVIDCSRLPSRISSFPSTPKSPLGQRSKKGLSPKRKIELSVRNNHILLRNTDAMSSEKLLPSYLQVAPKVPRRRPSI